jgi:subtilisin-like proprotein convertase family protein
MQIGERLALVVGLMVWLNGSGVSAASPAARYRINDHGQTRTFVLATNEVQVAGNRQPEAVTSAATAEAVRSHAEQLARARGREVQLVLYPEGRPRDEFSRRILTRNVLVKLERGVDAPALAKNSGATTALRLDYLPEHFLFAAPGAGGALELAESLRKMPGVRSAEPQLARRAQKKGWPNDPYFSEQWHLANTGQNGGKPGVDINVTNVWLEYRGANICIGIVDDGLQYTHPDLAPNAVTNIDYDFNGKDADPAPDPDNWDYHGTQVAGLAAARGNNQIGVCGVAYEAKLVGLRLIALPETDAEDAAAMNHSNAVIHVKNNSWGAPDAEFGGATLDGAGPLMRAAMAKGAAQGRGGKGVVYVWAGGNGGFDGENVNYDSYANSIYAIAVGVVNDHGQHAAYSEPGACLLVSAPSSDDIGQSITTTDLAGDDGDNNSGAWGDLSNTSYTRTFSGTSAATPLVSGVAALLLQANPNLGYRDVQEILLRSAAKVEPADADWRTNSAGIAHNHKFGGGLVNAQAAIHLATNWTCLGPVQTVSLPQSNLSIPIPDDYLAGVTRTFAFTNDNFRVEHLTLTMSAPHPAWGDLSVTVTSPKGLRSRLAQAHVSADPAYSYDGWTFSSVRHWGEEAKGAWTIKVADELPDDAGTLKSLELTLYGSSPAAALTLVMTNKNCQLELLAAAPGRRYDLEVSSNCLAWAKLATMTIAPSGQAIYSDTNAAAQGSRFYRAVLDPP